MEFVRSAGAPGLITRIPEPADPFRRPPWIRFGISKPKSPSCTQFQGLPGLKTRIPEPAGPFRCRLLGLQVRSRSAQHSVLSRTAANRCHSSPSAPLVPPQGPAAPSLAVPLCHALPWHFARHQAVAERKQGWFLCDGFAQRRGLGWNPSMDSCPDLQTLRFAHREGSNLNFVLKTPPFVDEPA